MNVYRVYMFITTSTDSTAEILENLGEGEDEAKSVAKEMVTKFGVVQAMGIFIAPINGFIIDKSRF